MPRFKAEHVRQALAAIRQNGIPEGFGPSTKWDIIDETTNEKFAPKAVLSLAKEFAKDESYSGGGGDQGTNNALRERGFRVDLKSYFEDAQETDDIKAIFASKIDPTTKQQLINARLGQGGFRASLLEIWLGKCALTSLAVETVLRASHIKAWRESNNEERLDPANGVLFAANVDALFDRHLISFDDEGYLQVSTMIEKHSLAQAGILPNARLPIKENSRVYFKHHIERFRSKCKSTYSY